MRDRIFLSVTIIGFAAAIYATAAGTATVAAAAGKNLKVYPADTDKKTIKADMKKIAKALGVQCDFCHDLSAMEKDTKHKKTAREMMRMTADINKKLKKDGFEPHVTCNTCHQGNEHPPKK